MLASGALCFLATWQFRSFCDVVENLEQLGLYNVPPQQLDWCRDRCFFVTEVPELPQAISTFASEAGIVGDF